MKFYISILLTAVFSFIAGIYLPWWSIAIVSFLVALFIYQKSLKSFVTGFVAIFILWAVLAFWIDMQNQNLLSQKVALILPLQGSSSLLILITAMIGAIVAGFAALSGSLLNKVIKSTK